MFEKRYGEMMKGVMPSRELVHRTLRAAEDRKPEPIAWKPLLMVALCWAMVVGGVAWTLLTTSSTRITASSSPDSDPVSFHPILSDELTLSVSNIEWKDASTLTFHLVLRGDKVDALTEYNLDFENVWLSSSGLSPDSECTDDQDENECHSIVTMEINNQLQEEIPETITLTIDRYTSGNTEIYTTHDIDWDAYDGPVAHTGEPIIDLGGGMSISGFGFNEEGWPTVQIRIPDDVAEPTHCIPLLDHAETPETTIEYTPWRTFQYSEGDYHYSNTSFSITREELDDMQLVTYAIIAGETIRGEWSITIDIPPRPAQ